MTTTTVDTTADTKASAAKDQRTLGEVACDLILVEHRLRDLCCWTPEAARTHLDAALTNVATAMHALYAEYDRRTSSPRQEES